jgi:hypothetical protein
VTGLFWMGWGLAVIFVCLWWHEIGCSNRATRRARAIAHEALRQERLAEDYMEAMSSARLERDGALAELKIARRQVKALKALVRRTEKALPARAIKVRE